MMPQISIENRMLIDSEWNEIEYGVPYKQTYDDEEERWEEDGE